MEEVKKDNNIVYNKLKSVIVEGQTFTKSEVQQFKTVFGGGLIDTIFDKDEKIKSNDKLKNLFYETELMRGIELTILKYYFETLSDIQLHCFTTEKDFTSQFNKWFEDYTAETKLHFKSLANQSFQEPDKKVEAIKNSLDRYINKNINLENEYQTINKETKETIGNIAEELYLKIISELKNNEEEALTAIKTELENTNDRTVSILDKIFFGGVGIAVGLFLGFIVAKL